MADAAVRASDAAVKALEDQVRAAEAQVAVARANRKQLDVQQSDLVATRAQLSQARADKNTADVRLGYMKIYAPLDGIVSVRAARQGEVLQAGEPIVTILDVDHLWVQADVEESYIDSIALNQHLKIRLPSGNTLEGTVIFKGVESDFATQRDVSRTKRDIKTFSIKVAVPNPERRLISGMTATVLLPPPPSTRTWWQRLVSAIQPAARVPPRDAHRERGTTQNADERHGNQRDRSHQAQEAVRRLRGREGSELRRFTRAKFSDCSGPTARARQL